MLKISNISKTFYLGTPNEHQAIRNIDLTIQDGDFVTVIGGNGAGKSTLLNLIAGVLLPDHGRIQLDDMDVTWLPEHKRAALLGRVFQDPMRGTAGDMGIDENLALAARRGTRRGLNWGITRKERESYRKTLSQLDLGLEGRLSAKVKLLSGGQRQALTLMMATLKQPRILLLDEHTAALDPKTGAKVLALTEELISKNNLTTMMITHNMKDAIRYGNRLLMLHEGRILVDISGEDKRRLHVEDLLHLFEKASGQELDNDRMLLS
jgi:putative ABC transport system ATP-binding protein